MVILSDFHLVVFKNEPEKQNLSWSQIISPLLWRILQEWDKVNKG